MKRLTCREVGFDCDKVIEAESEEEILRQAGLHVTDTHRMTVTPELVQVVRDLIRPVEQEAPRRE